MTSQYVKPPAGACPIGYGSGWQITSHHASRLGACLIGYSRLLSLPVFNPIMERCSKLEGVFGDKQYFLHNIRRRDNKQKAVSAI